MNQYGEVWGHLSLLPVWGLIEVPQSGSSCDYTALHCVEGGLQARCLDWFASSLVPLFSWFIIHQTSDWRPYFISPAFEKYLSSPAGSLSNRTAKSLILLLSTYIWLCASWTLTISFLVHELILETFFFLVVML